jgi:hypothetical protein
MGGSKVRGLEQYELGNGEIIVNITDHDDWSEVTTELAKTWTWESFQIEWDEEGNGEWLVLMNCKRRAEQAAA